MNEAILCNVGPKAKAIDVLAELLTYEMGNDLESNLP